MGKENYDQYLKQCLENEMLNLKRHCESLSRDLTRTAKEVDEKGIYIDVDSTGLVQNQGLQIEFGTERSG